MYLKQSASGQRHAAHLRPGESQWAPESDEHKALKERIARAATAAGFEATIEARAPHGRRRTDVLVHGSDVMLGCEPQLSPISLSSVRRRSEISYDDGITPLWTTNDRTATVIDQAPWARIDRMPWRDYLNPDSQMPVRGGVRSLTSIRCTPGTSCNDRKLGVSCTGWNHQFEPVELPGFDDLIVRAAAAELKPLKQPLSRGSVYFWATATDIAEVQIASGSALVATVGQAPPATPIGPASVRGGGEDCTYGDVVFEIATPRRPRGTDMAVPVQRSAEATAREARAAANLEALLVEISYRGGHLTGEPIRTSSRQPGCVGWLLPTPSGPVELLIPDTDLADLHRTSLLAPLLYIDGEPWWWYPMIGRLTARTI
ncbi:hypothetical protein L083_1669 [Actinoplanes sp. N902-109]|nr:hypothetical protein L083_1669 [Actinoplanes sp. N902-109]